MSHSFTRAGVMSQVGPFRRRFKAHGQFLRPQCAIKVKWHFLQTTMVFGRLAPGVFVCNLWSNQELSHTVCPAAVVITRLCLLQVNQSVQKKKKFPYCWLTGACLLPGEGQTVRRDGLVYRLHPRGGFKKLVQTSRPDYLKNVPFVLWTCITLLCLFKLSGIKIGSQIGSL